MLWAAAAIEAWDRLFLPGQPLRRLFLASEVLDSIEDDPEQMWNEALGGVDDPSAVTVVRTAVDAVYPTLWIFWMRENDGQPVILDFRVE
jgi:hypothetical protein